RNGGGKMKMISKSQVRHVTGKTKHSIGTIVNGTPIPISPLPAPTWVGIAQGQGGFFLLHLDAQATCFNDTWHESLEAAKRQAQFEFEISDDDWQSTEGIVNF